MKEYFTSGQVARRLHVSLSTLKRWLTYPELTIQDYRNCNGWRLFTEKDIETIKAFMREVKKDGKRFKKSILIPIFLEND